MIANPTPKQIVESAETAESIDGIREDNVASDVEGLLVAPIGEDACRDKIIEEAWRSLDH